MIVVYDQLNRAISLPSRPERIISTVPSQTELLFYLGLDEAIVGLTRFCTHPAGKVMQKTIIGGTKQLNIPLILELKPDLIIANKEENDREQIVQLINTGILVYTSDPSSLESALAMIKNVGAMTDRNTQADALAATVAAQFASISPAKSNPKVAYLIWRKPYMVAGRQTFIDAMLQQCGFVNAFSADRYPEVTRQDLIAAEPDVLLLSSEPYPFRQKHIDEFEAMLPGATVRLVDGEMFSWYGSRLLQSPACFMELIADLHRTGTTKN